MALSSSPGPEELLKSALGSRDLAQQIITLLNSVIAKNALTALTDNSGGATADGTIAIVTAPTALTDNGGGTADATVAAMTLATALTVTDGAGTNDGTIGAITADASVIAAVQEIAAKIATIITFDTAVKDNFKELTTAQAANRLAIIALTDAVKELSTKLNALIAA